MNPEIEARLQASGIDLAAETSAVSIFVREGCIAMARRTLEGDFTLGSSGMMTEKGVAYLVWREGQPRLAAKGGDVAADAAQVAAILKFSADLKTALQLPVEHI